MGQELINRKASGQGVLWSAKALFDNPEAVQAVHEDYIHHQFLRLHTQQF